MNGRKITGLPLPETPREAPPEIHGLVEAIEVTLSDSDSMAAAHVLGCAFDYLTRYFAGIASSAARHLELPGETSVAADFDSARLQLKESLTTLGEKSTDPISKMVRSVFYVGATRKTPTPRRHARLLDLGGIPIRGYRNLGEWVALEPGSGELATESKANRELLRYLPILKEWLTATATFFLDSEISPVEWVGPSAIEFAIQAEEATWRVGPIALPESVMRCLPRRERSSTQVTPDVEPASIGATTPVPPPVDLSTKPASVSPPAVSGAVKAVEATPEPAAAPPLSVTKPVPAPDVAVDEPVEAAPEPVVAPPSVVAKPDPAPDVAVDEPVEATPEPEEVAKPVPAPVADVVEPEEVVKPVPAPVADAVELEEVAKPVPAVGEPEKVATPAVSKAPLEDSVQSEESAPKKTKGEEDSDPPRPENVPTSGDEEDDSEFLSAEPDPLDVDFGPIEFARATTADSASELESNPFLATPEAPPAPENSFFAALESTKTTEAKVESEAGSNPFIASLGPAPIETPSTTSDAPDTTVPSEEQSEVEEPSSSRRKPPDIVQTRRAPTSAQVSAPLDLYPVVTGPPPEFFDEVPVDADYPEVLQTALNDLNGAIEANDSFLICGQMQRCFDLLIQFFAGLCGAVLQDLDPDQLFDFEVDDGRFDLEVKLDLVVSALSSLEVHWEGNDVATLIWSAFYDTLLPATDPNSAYLHTRLLGVEGIVPEPFMEFSELCSVVPGKGVLGERTACREAAHRYLPILSFWLENSTPLFLESEVDFVEEDGGDALSWAASVAGATLDGTPSGLWLEIASSRWNLPRPELAPVFVVGSGPDVLLPVIDELNDNLEKKDFARSGLFARVALDFLIQYFAGCAAALWRDQGEMSDQALELYSPEASLEEKERLLLLSLGSLSNETPVGLSLGKLFSRGSLQYRALIGRDTPEGMGSIAGWAQNRSPVSESELLLYLPLLRSWLGAANPWFGAGEQLFEEPMADGRLEGVVAFGDDFLEMVDPEYVIRLPLECLELVAPVVEEEDDTDVAADLESAVEESLGLPTLPRLDVGPPILLGHLARLQEAPDDRRAANAWLGSAFEYLIQYFAGLCTSVLGGSDAPLDADVLSYFEPKSSLREREILLVAAVAALAEDASSEVQVQIRDIFVDADGKPRPHSKFLGALGAGSLSEEEMLLSFWCRKRHQIGSLTPEEYRFAVNGLSHWLEAAQPFFAVCEHYAEDPGADGQEEMVLELADDYIDMVLPDYAIQVPARSYYEVLYRESDSAAAEDAATYFPEDVRPELLGPKSVELGGIADDTGDLLMGAATVQLGEMDFFAGAAGAYDSDDLFSGAAPTPASSKPATLIDSPYQLKPKKAEPKSGSTAKTSEQSTESALAEAELEAASRRRKKKRARKSELGTAVLDFYKKEHLEKARKRAEARARKEESEPAQLSYKLTYRGLKAHKQLGGRCHFGLIELTNTGGGTMKGTIEASHPCVKVQPSRFDGNEVRVTYQVDPSDMPSTGRAGIVLTTQEQRIELRLDRLVPSSWGRERSTSQALGIMSLPALAYSVWVLMLSAVFLGPSIEIGFSALATDSSAELPWSMHLKVWFYAMLAILPGATGVPAAVKALFSRWDYSVQEETRKALPLLMMLPTVVMALVMYATPFWTFAAPLTKLPALGAKLWPTVLTLGLNLLASSLFSMQTTVWWEDNSDGEMAKRYFRVFWVITAAIGIVATYFMS